jgi:N-acetylglucosaminyldiphosphoundecaprenol N-acetyl-beta-D-mannosaminyltransferase
MTDRADFLGCPVDRVTTADALRWIEQAIAEKTPRQIAVVNANKLYCMAGNERLRDVVMNAALIVPEWAIVWGARRLKLPPVPHSGGILILRDFIPLAAARGYRPYFFGASNSVVAALERKIERDHPTMKIAGFHHGYVPTPELEREVIDDIRRTRPDVLFVALGSPRQELWIADHMAELGVPVSIGVGGSFDVIAGLKRDTPSWARGRGLEWIYRLAKDPRSYWKRYLTTNSWFVAQVLRARLRGGPRAAS